MGKTREEDGRLCQPWEIYLEMSSRRLGTCEYMPKTKGASNNKKAERALLNERVRSTNNTLNMLKSQRDTCIEQLERVFNEEWMARCKEFIEVGRERQHFKTLKRQKEKFERLLYKKQIREGKHTGMHGVHIGNHSNSTRQNNTCCVHVERNENNRKQSLPSISCVEDGSREKESLSSNSHVKDGSREGDRGRENTWVKNLSSIPLTKDQIKALAHSPNYAIFPRSPPVGEYIVAIENACNQLQQGKAEELLGEIKAVLKKIHPPKFNITREERKAIKELRRDKTRMILTADKGVSMVVMDRDDYNQKADALLQQPAYRPIPNAPTNKYKTKLIALLKSIKTEDGINESTYKRLYPTGAGSPKFYGLPKIHKEGIPLRPIVSSIGAATYSTSKELSRILKPLVGKSPHHIQNNQDFMEHLKDIQLGPDEVMVSYDVRALFTSVPIQPALKVIEKLLNEDPDLQKRTLSTKQIMDLLEFCLRSTYFTYRGKFYEQVEELPWALPSAQLWLISILRILK